jgi:two-component system, OmpR family, response regulator
MHRTVLIAEDEPYIVQSLSFLLEKEGLEVSVAVDGQQTLERLRESAPDILLLDLMMEHLTGFDVLKIVRSESDLKNIKVLVLSAKGQENDRRRVMELGADKFITKPYANSDVVVSVLELLGLKTG